MNGNGPGFTTVDSPGLPAGLIDPIAQYDHDEGASITGGFVYRGDQVEDLQGTYVFGDFTASFGGPQGRIFNIDSNGQLDVVAAPGKQLLPHQFFQMPDPGAHRGLSDEKVLCGMGEMPRPPDLQKSPEELCIHNKYYLSKPTIYFDLFFKTPRVQRFFTPLRRSDEGNDGDGLVPVPSTVSNQ